MKLERGAKEKIAVRSVGKDGNKENSNNNELFQANNKNKNKLQRLSFVKKINAYGL
jgi:hypothetical protein